MGKILIPSYSLQVEFLNYGKHGLHYQMFIRKGEDRVASTPPQPANLALCLELLADIAKVREIPDDERIGLGIQLETAFRQRAEEDRKKVVLATPIEQLAIGVTSDVITALQECVSRKK